MEPDWGNFSVPGGLQELSPWAARLFLAVERFIQELVRDTAWNGPVLLGLSGGPDSTALAVIMKLLAGRTGFGIAGAHVDHGLRPESVDDARFCAMLCERLDIPFYGTSKDIAALGHETGTGIEDAGRTARYGWFREVSEKIGADVVATGHQLNELAADQLMRLLRGAGWPALGGMPAWDPARRILRPLLMTPKAELQRLLEELRIPWREDASNRETRFTRNRVTLNILPLVFRENPDYLAACTGLWRQAAMDREHWARCVLEAEADSPRPDFLPNAVLKRASAALRLRLYKRAVEALGPGQPLSNNLRRLDQAWVARATAKRLQFPGGKTAEITPDGIRFRRGRG